MANIGSTGSEGAQGFNKQRNTLTMNTRYTIDKLTDNNYLVWATQVQLVLEAKGLWSYVEGKESSSSSNADQVHKEKRQCMAEIILNIDSKFVAAVLNKAEPKDVWETLKQMHKSKSAASICQPH